MGRPKGGHANARERLLEAAGRGFRTGGYGGIGVDGLAKEAGLTSGAFYAHFGSKADAFRLALVEGLDVLAGAVSRFRTDHGDGWRGPFVDFYFGTLMQADLTTACALPTFTADAARADGDTRDAYGAALDRVADAIAAGLEGPDAQRRAWTMMSLMAGGAGMARAVTDPDQRAAILDAARSAALAV